MLKKKARFVWKGHLNSHPCPSSEKENIWGHQLWNVSILSRVWNSRFLIGHTKVSVNAMVSLSATELSCIFPCSRKLLRGMCYVQKCYLSTSSHHCPQLFVGVPDRIGNTEENEFREKKRRASEFWQEEEKKWSKPSGYLITWDKHACMNKYYKTSYEA